MEVKTRYRYWRMRRVKDPKQRLYAGLLMAGAGILIFRTLRMVTVEQAFEILTDWAYTLLVLEFMLASICFLTAFRWFILSKWKYASTALKLGTWAAIFHAFRVLIYVLGRTPFLKNFDVKPEHHATYTFDWFWVYFAATFSVLGLIGVYVIWRLWLRRKKSYASEIHEEDPI